ncbi:MAG: LPS assembly protein LptD [Holosporales bacterium]|nr:LPS assembly protein LptD [Holosporales bacterium]
MRGYLFFIRIILVISLYCCSVGAEIILSAEQISYDFDSGTITASGGVIVTQNLEDGSSRELHSEEIVYHKNSGIIRLHGDTIIREPTGEIIAARNVELDKDLENAIAKAFLVVLTDASKVRARDASKKSHIFSFNDATYTPCSETHCSLPLWDIAADKVTYDSKKKSFVYSNAKLRFKGVPVFFLPYFKHPAFGVKRQSGFLSPIIRSNNDTGLFVGVPYFIVIDNDKDLKLTPFLNTKGRGFAAGEYRQALTHGDIDISASVLTKTNSTRENTDEREKRTRWHVDSTFKSFALDNKRLTLRVNRSSDVTYKLKYPVQDRGRSGFIWQRRYNESNLSLEFFDKDYFIKNEALLYQTPDNATSPVVLPHFSLIKRYQNVLNETVEVENDTVYLSRNQEKAPNFAGNFFRSTNRVNWKKNIKVDKVAVDLLTGIRGDIFRAGSDNDLTGKTAKFCPAVENQISGFMPFVSQIPSLGQTSIWGPRITLSSLESFGSRNKINQNEDSVLYSIDDLNLHALNRIGGFDDIEEGERVSAGLENSIYNSRRRWLHFFVGNSQTIRDAGKKDKPSGRNSAVGRFVIKPFENLAFRTRFVGIPVLGQSKMFESGVNFEIGKISTDIGYVYDVRPNKLRNHEVSQLGISVSFKLTKFWKISGSKVMNLKKKSGNRNLLHSLFADYQDECFGMGFGIHKSNFSDKDIKPNVGIIFVLSFKNLGNISKPTKNYLYRSELCRID